MRLRSGRTTTFSRSIRKSAPEGPPCGREVISLPDLMERYGASREDMELLVSALQYSDELSATEIEAMEVSKRGRMCLTDCTADRVRPMRNMPAGFF